MQKKKNLIPVHVPVGNIATFVKILVTNNTELGSLNAFITRPMCYHSIVPEPSVRKSTPGFNGVFCHHK